MTPCLGNNGCLIVQEPAGVELDYLGTDSLRHHIVSTVNPLVYSNMKRLAAGKVDSKKLFDAVRAPIAEMPELLRSPPQSSSRT